ncbi:MAG: DUF2905 domain-containing protein [Candidatus Omnitrophota bacterium]
MMNPVTDIGRTLVFFGAILLLAGCFLWVGGKLPWVGRLPGDILIEKKQFHFYFPLATSLLLSLLLSLLFSLFGRK